MATVRVILAVIGKVLRRNNLHGSSGLMTEDHDALVGSNRSLACTGNTVVIAKSSSLLMKRILTKDAVHIKFTDTSMQEFHRNLKQKFRKKNR
jgi:hypothetical protein